MISPHKFSAKIFRSPELAMGNGGLHNVLSPVRRWINNDLKKRAVQSCVKLCHVKQSLETAMCESMHGGVRGRGSNPAIYSFIIGCGCVGSLFSPSSGLREENDSLSIL